MKSTEYLYELNLEMLEKMNYFQALQYKANCAKRLYQKLLNESKYSNDFELHERMFYVYKAWQHTLKLLKEKEERE